MIKEYGVLFKIEYYGCMVDLFCRVGFVKEVFEFVEMIINVLKLLLFFIIIFLNLI